MAIAHTTFGVGWYELRTLLDGSLRAAEQFHLDILKHLLGYIDEHGPDNDLVISFLHHKAANQGREDAPFDGFKEHLTPASAAMIFRHQEGMAHWAYLVSSLARASPEIQERARMFLQYACGGAPARTLVGLVSSFFARGVSPTAPERPILISGILGCLNNANVIRSDMEEIADVFLSRCVDALVAVRHIPAPVKV
jgi:hypothetical protein